MSDSLEIRVRRLEDNEPGCFFAALIILLLDAVIFLFGVAFCSGVLEYRNGPKINKVIIQPAQDEKPKE